jgi:hypothetical protein
MDALSATAHTPCDKLASGVICTSPADEPAAATAWPGLIVHRCHCVGSHCSQASSCPAQHRRTDELTAAYSLARVSSSCPAQHRRTDELTAAYSLARVSSSCPAQHRRTDELTAAYSRVRVSSYGPLRPCALGPLCFLLTHHTDEPCDAVTMILGPDFYQPLTPWHHHCQPFERCCLHRLRGDASRLVMACLWWVLSYSCTYSMVCVVEIGHFAGCDCLFNVSDTHADLGGGILRHSHPSLQCRGWTMSLRSVYLPRLRPGYLCLPSGAFLLLSSRLRRPTFTMAPLVGACAHWLPKRSPVLS